MAEEPTVPERFDDDLQAISHWAGDVTPPDPWLLSASVPAAGPGAAPASNERPAWQRSLAVAASIVVVLVGVLVLTRGQGSHQTRPSGSTSPTPSTQPTPSTADPAVPTTTSPAPSLGNWTATAQSPLSPRNQAQAVWLGNDVAVFGGTTQPACPLCDYAAYGDSLHDGALYNPATDAWRRMAPLPDEASYVGQSVADGGDIWYYSLFHPDVMAPEQTYRLWHYSVADDAWNEVELPTPTPKAAVLAPNPGMHGLLLYSATDEFTEAPDWSLDLTTNAWTQLPDDPFEPSFDRQLFEVGGNLWLFNHDIGLVQQGVTPLPTRIAVLDPQTGNWSTLPETTDVDSVWFVDGDWVISPKGGYFDTRNMRWMLGPSNPPDSMGAIGPSTAFFGGVTGSVYDFESGAFLPLPTLPDGLDQESGQTTVAAGRDLFTFGGTTGMQPTDPVHNRAFLWRSPTLTEHVGVGTGQEALDAALADLGIDLDTAPAGLFTLGTGTFCGYEKNTINGNEDLHENARRCFRDAVRDRQTAMFITQRTTVEGAPTATVFVTADRVTKQYYDSTRDPFGSQQWSSNECNPLSFTDSGVHLEINCEHNDVGSIEPLTLTPAGGCGAAGFAAISADQTVALNIYLTYGNEIGVVDDTFTIPEAKAVVELRRGRNLGEGICNDVIATMQVDRKSDAVAGTLHLTTSPNAGQPVGSTACGAMSGLLTTSGLEFADGTKLSDLRITTTGLNCFAG